MKKVYVIGPNGGPFKVGIAENPSKRVKFLQIGNHLRLEVLFEFETEEAELVEFTVHKALNDKRLTGEWFGHDLQSIISAIENYKMFINIKSERERRKSTKQQGKEIR